MSRYLQAVASLPKSLPFSIFLVASVEADGLSPVEQLAEEKEPTQEPVPRVKVKPSG
jgi:hypothetical protein